MTEFDVWVCIMGFLLVLALTMMQMKPKEYKVVTKLEKGKRGIEVDQVATQELIAQKIQVGIIPDLEIAVNDLLIQVRALRDRIAVLEGIVGR